MKTERETYLDWLRIAAIFGVLIYHSGRPFITDDPWHINNATTSDLLGEFNFFLSRFRMHLLFFISGAVTLFIVRKRTTGSFIGLRFKRLFIPVVAGMLLVVPPQVYVERLSQGFTGNFLDFYPSIFEGKPYPEGNTSWHHLWFIVYLFTYDLLLAPFFTWSVSDKGRAFVNKLRYFAVGYRVYLLIVPSVVWYSLMVVQFPSTNDLIHDLCYYFYWLIFLLIGFLCMLQPALMESLERNRRTSLGVAFILLIFINYLRWNDFDWSTFIPNWESDWRTPFFIARQSVHSWFWVFALIGYGKKYLTWKPKFMNELNLAIYPFYILHQTVIVVIAYYVVQTPDSIGMKYLFIILSTLFVSIGIYHLIIRRFTLLKFLFGMKTGDANTNLIAKAAPKMPALAKDLK